MQRSLIETILGVVVLAVTVFFIAFAWKVTQYETSDSYLIQASFNKIGGLKIGNDVRVNGVKVGAVVDKKLDTDTWEAVVSMAIFSTIDLPQDTLAQISDDGFMGAKYVRLHPGQEKIPLASGEKIKKTKDYQAIEDLLSNVIFLATGN